MLPVLASVFGRPIGTYGLLMALGLMLGIALAMRLGKRDGVDGDALFTLVVAIFVGSFVGAKAFQAVATLLQPGATWADAASSLGLSRAGAVHGGVLTGFAIFLVGTARSPKLPRWATGDAIVPGLAVGQTIGRVGCFFGGCCFGTESTMPWAVTFTREEAHMFVGTPLHVPLHPVQLYMALASLAVTAILVVRHARRRFAGEGLALYFVLEGVARIVTETWRGDLGRGVGWGGIPWLSTGRLTALGFVALGGALWISLARGRRRPSPPMPAPSAG